MERFFRANTRFFIYKFSDDNRDNIFKSSKIPFRLCKSAVKNLEMKGMKIKGNGYPKNNLMLKNIKKNLPPSESPNN
ncbi:hypothetical protein [Rhodonellum sp.]|uniref:hypothetical protein n=1 Tax=Rhodonellum sp. TaxID=2231180 RepID=UPI00272C0CD6|nr:hypothetical protein [Rhodonellum sp.]